MQLQSFIKYFRNLSVSPRKAGMTGYYTLLILILLFLVLRRPILHYAVHKITGKIEHSTGDTVKIGEYDYVGIRGIYLKNICVIPRENDTLLYTDSLFVKVRILPLLVGRIRLADLEVHNAFLYFKKKDDHRNYAFLFSQKKDSVNKVSAPHTYDLSEMLSNAAEKVFHIIPHRVLLDSCRLLFSIDGQRSEIRSRFLNFENKEIDGKVIIRNKNQIVSDICISGIIDRSEKYMKVRMNSSDRKPVVFPMLEQALQANLSFDSIQFGYSNAGYHDGALKISLSYDIHNFRFRHDKIARGTMVMRDFTSSIHLNVGSNFIEIDSSSWITVNRNGFHPYLRKENTTITGLSLEHFVKSGPLEIRIPRTNWDASTFFMDLPEGIFSTINTISAKGQIHYSLVFSLDPEHIDSLRFLSRFEPEKMTILSWGALNITKLNDTFRYDAYEKGEIVASFLVGPQNSYFTPLEHISPMLVNCVLTSEDGSFMHHRGFNEEAFNKSIADNIKDWRFVRGGSTISMQLVKNVFLTRNKNIARKIEEVLIVWMLENYRLSSKERMLEVYLNIIEWGPGIYGVAQASNFYYNKPPSQLTLSESIFLASIIPSPKRFYSVFDKSGMTRSYYKDYIRLLTGFMLRRGQISESDTAGIPDQVVLAGEALEFVRTKDSLVASPDSLHEGIMLPIPDATSSQP